VKGTILNPILNLVIALAGIGAGIFLAKTFWKAGSFKCTNNKMAIDEAFAWAKNVPHGVIVTIGLLEIAGAIGVVVAPIVALVPGFAWAQPFGIAAAAGLALTMLVAAIMHGARGELKYTAKANFSLLAISVAAAVLNALVVLPLSF
jgi:uncharacterized membrane protein YphA (DoxX/SURF4 family)